MKGRHGASSEEYWQEVVAKVKLDYDSGKFLIGAIGTSRQLDLSMMAALLELRQELLDGIDNPTAGDGMLADSAIIAYRNLLRIQGWVGSLCLVVERQLFGQIPLDGVLASVEAAEVNAQVERLGNTLLPLQDRAQRMLLRALDRLEAHRLGKTNAPVSIGQAGQVNVGGIVQNESDGSTEVSVRMKIDVDGV